MTGSTGGWRSILLKQAASISAGWRPRSRSARSWSSQPFLWLSGGQSTAFVALGIVFAIGGILGAYTLARQLLPPGRAALAAALLALFPGYLAYATSFMSDVPSTGCQFFCLAFGAMALRRRPTHLGWLLASAGVGLFAFSIREFGLAAPTSVIVAALIADRGRKRTWAVAVGVASSCRDLSLESTLPGQLPPLDSFGSFALIQIFSTVAFAVVPAALVGAIKWRHHVRRTDLLIGLEVGAILAAARLFQWWSGGSIPSVTLDNLASQWGAPAPDYLVGGRPLLFSDAVWAIVQCFAIVGIGVVLTIGAGILGAHVRRCGRSPRVLASRAGTTPGILVVFSLTVLAGMVVYAASRPVFDRYFWVAIPPIATLFMFVPKDLEARSPKPSDRRLDRTLAASATLFALVSGTVSLALLLNAHAFDFGPVARGRAACRERDRARHDRRRLRVGRHPRYDNERRERHRRRSVLPQVVAFDEDVRSGHIRTDEPTGCPVGRHDHLQPEPVVGPVETLFLYRVDGPGR